MDNPNQHLIKIKEILFKLATELNSLNITWLLGGSGGLMVNGVDIVPHDLDIFVEDKQIENIQQKFSQHIKEPLHNHLWKNEPSRKFKLLIDDIEIEIIKLNQNQTNIQKIKFNEQLIPVNCLKDELEFYKSRPEKESTVKLIEEKLLHQ